MFGMVGHKLPTVYPPFVSLIIKPKGVLRGIVASANIKEKGLVIKRDEGVHLQLATTYCCALVIFMTVLGMKALPLIVKTSGTENWDSPGH